MLHFQKIKNSTTDQWMVLLHGLGGSMRIFNKQTEAFSSKYNVLLIDLHGHGDSQSPHTPKERGMKKICADIISVMDINNISEASFCGISLGSIIITIFASLYPQRVSSIILGGGILKCNMRTNILYRVAQYARYFIPYMWLYQFFAWIIMPHRRHTKSRNIFIQEAVNLGHKEFCCWLNSLMPYRNLEHYINIIDRHIKKIPVLVLMGDEDHMFLTNTVQTALRIKGVCICIFKECGHVCNIEKAKDFNEIVLHFLKNRTINHKSEIFTHTPHQHTLLVS